MMEAAAQEKIIAVINEKFEGEIVEAGMVKDFLTIILKSGKIVDIIGHLYHHTDTKFQFLTTLCGIHVSALTSSCVINSYSSLTTFNKNNKRNNC